MDPLLPGPPGEKAAAAFARTGVVHLRRVLPLALLREVRGEIAALMAERAGRRPFPGVGIDRWAVQLHRRDPALLVGLQQELGRLPGLYRLALHPRLARLLHDCCGWYRSALSPIHNLRAKLPWHMNTSAFTNVPWHQDHGASDPACDPLSLVTVWVPLTLAGARQGGLELIPGSPRLGWLAHHRGERGPEVRPEALAQRLGPGGSAPAARPVAVEARPGDVVLFDQLTLHRSIPNRSHRCRWSLDLRYAAAGFSTGRPGLWDHDPVVGECGGDALATLVEQRQAALAEANLRVRRRVDQEAGAPTNFP